MDLPRAAFAIAPPLAAAVVGGLSATDAASTYARLDKPSWAPPANVFGPAWSVLYTSIGVAGWRMYPRVGRRLRALHLAQVAVNAAWPATFFGVRDKQVSLAVIATLDVLIAAELVALARTDRTSAAVLTPYAAWTAFATALNVAVSDPAA